MGAVKNLWEEQIAEVLDAYEEGDLTRDQARGQLKQMNAGTPGEITDILDVIDDGK